MKIRSLRLLLCGVAALPLLGLNSTLSLAQPAGPRTYSTPAGGQDAPAPKPMPSPPATTETKLNGKTITVKYNQPAMRGRKVMGGLVPYGKVWRTGANPATSFETAGDIMIGTLRVPAGSYTLFTLPAAPGTPWMLIINKQTGQWGLDYDESKDFGRVPMASATLPRAQEIMSISFKKAESSVTMHVKWETTDEFVTISPAS